MAGTLLDLRTKAGANAAAATTIAVIGCTVQVALWSVVALMVLGNLGFNITSLIAGLCIGGIAAALAAQSILGHALASLTIALDRPFAIGDFIVAGDIMRSVDTGSIDRYQACAWTATTCMAIIVASCIPDSRFPMSPLTQPRWALVVLAMLVVGAAWLGYRWFAGPKVDVIKAEPSRITQTVVVSGRVLTPAKVDIGATITGRVAKVNVDEGDHVAVDQDLIELEHDELAAALRAAQAQEAAARNKIAQWRETGLPGAQQALVQAEENYRTQQRAADRAERLFAQGFIGEAALDESRRAAAVARSQLETAKAQYGSSQKNGAEYRLLEDQLRQASASRETAAAKLVQTVIRAPAAGTVLARNVEGGDIVQPGKALLTVSLDGDTRLTALIDEKNLAVLREGQRATVSADAFPADRFSAELIYLSPGIDVQRGTVEAKFRVREPPKFLRADMTVSIEVEVADRANAIVVPLSAVHDAASEAPWVVVVRDGRAEKQQVRIGARTAADAEIADGLAAGTLVVVGGNPDLGARARTAGD